MLAAFINVIINNYARKKEEKQKRKQNSQKLKESEYAHHIFI